MQVPDTLLQPSMVLLDVGMATHLAGKDRENMIGLFEAFSDLDGPGIAEWVLKFSGPDQSCTDPQARILLMAAKKGSNVLFCMSNRTQPIPLVSVMPSCVLASRA
jgi:hypothetical protein